MADTQPSKFLPSRWTSAWSSATPSAWLSLYAPAASYTDHAFQIRRIGPSALQKHWEIWRTSIPDFTMTLESEIPPVEVGDGRILYSVRTINRGTFEKDLPNKKASGREFDFRGVVDLYVDGETGLIEEVREWYSWAFDQGKNVSEYNVRGEPGA